MVDYVVNVGGRAFTYRAKRNAFAVLYISDDATIDALVQRVREQTGCTSLEAFYAMGKDGLAMSWEETNAGFEGKVIQAILDAGYALYMNDGSQVTFPPYSHYSEALKEVRRLYAATGLLATCGREAVKTYFSLDPNHWRVPFCKKMIRKIRQLPNDGPTKAFTIPIFDTERALRNKWQHKDYGSGWSPELEEEYKVLQHKIREEFDYPLKDVRTLGSDADETMTTTTDTDSPSPLRPHKRARQHPGGSAANPVTILEAEKMEEEKEQPPPPPPLEPIKKNDPCCVCLEREANTMVLPCEHVVCCKECSIQLRGGINARKCVYCRRPITDILE